MTPEEAIEQLKKLIDEDDIEEAHGRADAILCDFLEALGYADIVKAWDKIEKWYA